MRVNTIWGTNLRLSHLGFGLARLHRLSSVNAQSNLVKKALDLGITHFDVAPLYGFGNAERLLGSLLARERTVSIATKVALYPPGGANQTRFEMGLRKLGGRFLPSLSRPLVNFCVKSAGASLDGSLRRLSRSFVELALIHEPDISIMLCDEWQRWCERQESKVGVFGVAGDTAAVAPFLERDLRFSQVVQTNDSLALKEADSLADYGRKMQLTYGYLASVGPGLDANSVIRSALRRNFYGTVLVSTLSASRLSLLTTIADEL